MVIRIIMKQCTKCKEIKELKYFFKRSKSKDGYNYEYKICMKISSSDWRFNNPDRNKIHNQKWYVSDLLGRKLYSKNWNINNHDKVKENNKNWYKNNKTKANQNTLRYHKEKYKNDPLFRLTENIRSSISTSLKNKGYVKKSRTYEILGCTYEKFKIHIEFKFEEWMTWENKGLYNGEFNYGWDIDHIIPLSSAKSEEELLELNHYTNFQPLCSKINRDIKRDRLDYGKN